MKTMLVGKARPYNEILSSLELPMEYGKQQDISMRAREAADACNQRKTGASKLWYTVLQQCQDLGISAIEILSIPHESGQTLAGVVMTSRDWDSCEVLYKGLANGVYLVGALVRQDDRILYHLDKKGRAIGLQFLQEGPRYGGEFWQGMRHDRRGVLDFKNGVIYDGGFLNGGMTGWGRAALSRRRDLALEGVFLDGEFLGDPRALPRSANVRQGFLQQCRKLMDLNARQAEED